MNNLSEPFERHETDGGTETQESNLNELWHIIPKYDRN